MIARQTEWSVIVVGRKSYHGKCQSRQKRKPLRDSRCITNWIADVVRKIAGRLFRGNRNPVNFLSYNPTEKATNRVNEQQHQARSQPMDESELRAQLEQLHPVSYGWALSCCSSNPMEAEDILQTAYLKILDSRARFDGRAAFKTWLFAVIRRTAADERRRNWLRRLRLEGFSRERAGEAQPAARGDALDQMERRKLFREALAKLPRRQQEVLHLVFYQDLTVEEAARVMGVSLGSARTHYERGKHRLGEWLQRSENFDEHRR
jgi:RNA polymerase sigma-70 factor (ECF subfamily)